jgi:AbrB family looped-hinge helix DNA binding protein
MAQHIQATKVTSKGQATIPRKVRDFLHIEVGDSVVFAIDGDQVILRRAEPLDAGFLKLATESFVDWNASEADDAFRDL